MSVCEAPVSPRYHLNFNELCGCKCLSLSYIHPDDERERIYPEITIIYNICRRVYLFLFFFYK